VRFIDIATINDTHNVSMVPMTRAKSLRSRMTLTCHVRFWSRAEGVTPSLRLTSKITRACWKPWATCERISRFIITSDCIRHWTIKRLHRCIWADNTNSLERLSFVLFLL